MMYILELLCLCICKDERGKNDLWLSVYGFYLYNYICILFEIFFFLFCMYSIWLGCFLYLLRDIYFCIFYYLFLWFLILLEFYLDNFNLFSVKSGFEFLIVNRGFKIFK